MAIGFKQIASKILSSLTYAVFGISFVLSAYILWAGIEDFYIDGKTFESDREKITFIIDSLIFPVFPTFFSLLLPILLLKKHMRAFAFFAALACFFFFVFCLIPFLQGTVNVAVY